MTDPWAAPDQGGPPNWGWGAPPPPPSPPRTWLPLAVVLAVAVVAVVAGVALRPPNERAADPTPLASRRPTPSATASPTPTPTRVPTPRPTSASPAPQPVRTYSPPPEGVPVTGRVVDAAGRPVAGAVVVMQRDEGWAGALARGLTALFTLGLACFAEVCTVPYGEGRTDSDGRYTLYLEKETSDYTFSVARRGGPTMHADVAYRGRALRLPDAVYWDPTPRLEITGTRARIRFRSPPSSVGAWRSADAAVTDAKGESDLLRYHRAESGETFDARLLEDLAVGLRVAVEVRTRLGDTTYTSTSSARGRWRPGSRGAACVEYGKGDRALRRPRCALTDGDLLERWDPKVADWNCPNNSPCDRKVDVDLGVPRRLRYLAVRVCDDFFDSVQVSADGVTWDTVMAEDGNQGGDVRDVCARELDVVARYVRVNGPAGGFYSRRTEVSAFW